MLKTMIRRLFVYRKKRLRKKSSIKRTQSVNKNIFNPFINNEHSSSIAENLIMLLKRTPEEDDASMQRVMNMLKLMAHPYLEEKINNSVSKFTHINKNEDYYYEVQKIKMNQEQYQQYLDKKALNEKLRKKLPLRKKEKRAKL